MASVLPLLVTTPAAPLKLGTLTLYPARSKVPPLADQGAGAQGGRVAHLQRAVLDLRAAAVAVGRAEHQRTGVDLRQAPSAVNPPESVMLLPAVSMVAGPVRLIGNDDDQVAYAPACRC